VRYAREALLIGQRTQDPDAAQCFTAQIFGTHSGMRSLLGIELPVQQFAEHYLALPAWRAALALRYAGSGAIVEAQRELDHFAADNFRSIPHDRNWLITLTNIARVCAVVADPMRAAVLYDLLLPYAARNIVAQPALFFLGSVCRVLGMLAATMGRWGQAEAHYEEALRQHREIQAGPLVVLTLQQYAPMFFDRNQPGDWERAMALLDQIVQTARELGMDESEQRALTIKRNNQERPPEIAAQTTPRPQPRLALVKGKEEQRDVPAPTARRDRARSRGRSTN
jgi:tetratricopeptide (TPR) repeat protein